MNSPREALALPPGSEVGRYRLRGVRNEWGFYLAYDAEETVSGRKVVVHELLPEELVARAGDGIVKGRDAQAGENFAWARTRFLDESRALAACSHPGLEKVIDVFEANGTAYRVTPEETGYTLKQWLATLGRTPTEAELRRILDPALEALAAAHRAGLLHLNLKPDTIRIDAEGRPQLGHFAGARQAIARHSHGAGAATAGYSAPEQYEADEAENFATDIYALAAVGYRAITGRAPAEAPLRQVKGPGQKLAELFAGVYSARLLAGLDAGLLVDPAARPRDVAAWRALLDPSPVAHFIEEMKRRPLISAASGLAVICAVVLLGRALLPDPPVPPDDAPATPAPVASPTPTPKPTPEPTPTPKPTPEATPTPKPTPEPTPIPKPTPEPTPAPKPTPPPTPLPKPAPEATPPPPPPPQPTPPPPPPQPTPPSPPTPRPNVTGSVGSSLEGVWQTVQKNSQGQPLLRLTIFGNNRYELTGARQDSGLTYAKLGVLNMSSDSGKELKSTFKYQSMSRMATDGDIGKHEWERIAAAPTPAAQK